MEWSLFLIITIILVFLDTLKRKNLTYILLFILFMTIGFRYRVGWDFDNYVRFYNSPLKTYLKDKYFIELMLLLKNNKLDSQTLFFTVTFIKNFTIFYISNKLVRYRSISIYLYLTITYFFGRDLSNLRQSLAESCFLWILYIVIIKKKYIGLLFNLGGNFHNSLLPANLFLIASFFRIEKKRKYIILILSIVLGIFIEKFFRIIMNLISGTEYYKYMYYLEEKNFHNFLTPLSFLYMVFIIISTLIFIENGVIKKRVETLKKIENIYLVSLAYLLSVVKLQGPVARLGYYGLLCYIFIFPIHFESILRGKKTKEKNLKKILMIGILVCYGGLFLGEFVVGEKEYITSSYNRVLRFKFKIFKDY